MKNGSIQEKAITIEIPPITEYDFVVDGNNSVTKNTADHSILTNWGLRDSLHIQLHIMSLLQEMI